MMFWLLARPIVAHFVSFTFFVTLMTWISLLIGAAITFVVRTDHGLPKTFRGFLRFFLPPEIIRSRSCRIDAVFWIVSRVSLPFLVVPFLLGSAVVSTLTYRGLTDLMGVRAQNPESTLVWLCVAVAVTIAADFATFYTHYLDHKIRVMWEFHKVHHSAEFLIPLTNKRFHPVQRIFDDSGVALVTGFMLGGFSYAFSMPIYDNTVVGLDAYFLLNALSFYHLRHSHINMTYGRLESWILSPAQHHLHHSREDRHWDKNFGLMFSVWDRMFGTLLYSEPKGSFRLGLPESEALGYGSVLGLYMTPFVNLWKMGKNTALTAFPRPLADTTPEPSSHVTTS